MQIKSLASLVNAFFNLIQKVTATGKVSFLRNSRKICEVCFFTKINFRVNKKKNSLKIFSRKIVYMKINFLMVDNVDFK